MNASEPLQITSAIRIDPGTTPVVIVGANGTGKSMLGVELASRGAERIGARRALEIPSDIAPVSLAIAEQQRQQVSNQFRRQRSAMQGDLPHVLAELQAQELELGRSLRDRHLASPDYRPSHDELVSNFDHAKRIWHELFPKRELSFKSGQPRVIPGHRGAAGAVLAQNEMSDGERQALYLSLKVATIRDGHVIVIDEPETHLHPALARRLWDMLQDFRPNSRFVYITHDVHFALSRRAAVYVACRANGAHEVVPALPEDVMADILGAASMPVGVNRVVFCEGSAASLDAGLFDAWFAASQTTVYPVGSCDNVVVAVEGFARIPNATVNAIGIVDQDARCDEELTHLRSRNIHVLPVAEIEHLYALPNVVVAVLAHIGVREPSEVAVRLKGLAERLTDHYRPASHRLALERAQDRLRWHFRFPLSRVSPGANATEAESNLVAAYNAATTNISPSSAYADATSLVGSVVASGETDRILKHLPGKGSLACACQVLGMQAEPYVRLVREGLRGQLTEQLKNSLRGALTPYLP